MSGVLLPALLVVLIAASFASAGLVPAAPVRVQAEGPFLQEHPIVVVADRFVCSMLGSQQAVAGVVGEDGSRSVVVGGVVYWSFGDTVLADGGMIPNSIGWSADRDAADCITLLPKGEAGRTVALLPQDRDSEMTVWPLGMAATASDTVHFYYASIISDPEQEWQVAGVGLASFNTKTLAAERALDGAIAWPVGMPLPSSTFTDGRYVYVLLAATREPWTTDTILARVPKESIESLASYEYWQPAGLEEPGRWLAGLWDEESGTWDARIAEIGPLWSQIGYHNGAELAYNEFLDRWLAVYATGFMTSLNVRAADDLTGPWDGPETTLVSCPAFHPLPYESFVCYSAAQQELYARDGGRTIYVSYSNSDAYQVYLHEIRLAAPIMQWSDREGRTVYLAGDAQGPDGLTPDGLAFYASDIAVSGLSPIHRWLNLESGDVRYGAAPPAGPYRDLGVDFYAAADAASAKASNALYAPVYRWTLAGVDRYSPLNLAPSGYVRHELAFYAPCPDADGDGLTDCSESFSGTDPSSADSDGDGLPDGYERSTLGCDPLVSNDDLDGVPWLDELLAGTNPCISDSGARDVRALDAAIEDVG